MSRPWPDTLLDSPLTHLPMKDINYYLLRVSL